MPFSEFLKHKVLRILVFIPVLFVTALYVLALGGALLIDKNAGNVNEAYRYPLMLQALVWVLIAVLLGSYNNFCEKNGSEPSPKAMKIMGYILLAVTIVGLVLGELFSGFYFGRWGIFS